MINSSALLQVSDPETRPIIAQLFDFGKGASRWLPAAALFTWLLIGSTIACAGGGISWGTPDPAEVSGVVLDIAGESLTEIESLTVRDGSGVTWKFVAEGYAGMTPSHLRQHMVLGQRITVSFHEAKGAQVIDKIVDQVPADDGVSRP